MEEGFFKQLLQQSQTFFMMMNDLCLEEMKKQNIPVNKKTTKTNNTNTTPSKINNNGQTSTNSQKTSRATNKQKKDPDAPKKPRSAYIYFCSHVRQKYPDKIKEVPFAQQSVVMGREWQKLPENKKEIFNKLAQTDKERYELEQQKYDAERGIVTKPQKSRSKKLSSTIKNAKEKESQFDDGDEVEEIDNPSDQEIEEQEEVEEIQQEEQQEESLEEKQEIVDKKKKKVKK